MPARFCGRCQKLIDDIQCSHCGMQTEPMSMTPPWVEDYERDETEDEDEDEQTHGARLNSLRACPRHP